MVEIMNEKALKVLEYDKILKMLEEKAQSELAKNMIKELQPLKQIDEVKYALKETQDAVNLVSKLGTPSLAGIYDIGTIIRRAEIGGVLSPRELLRIGHTLRVSRGLKKYTSDFKNDVENIVKDYIYNLVSNRNVEDSIFNAIISEDEISDRASTELARIRRRISSLKDKISEKLNQIIKNQKFKNAIQESVVTIRGDRFVVPVKQEHRAEISGLVHDSSASGATVFVEPLVVVELNNEIKQENINEQKEIERILQELTDYVLDIKEVLKANSKVLSMIDFAISKAKLAIELDAICPDVSEDKCTNIVKGRHPLLNPKEVVPIDLWIGKDFKTLVITGPNTGGKTVTLKTLGLFTMMSQAGLHIPAKAGTNISIYEEIYADIGDEQSIEQSLSTFSSHMSNIVNILKSLNNKSLVLLDELGAGTDPTEGAALAISILNNLFENDVTTMCSTHYSELKVYALSTQGVENASCEFNVNTLSPTYKLLIGIPGKSNAFAISKRLGLSDDIIENAKAILTEENIAFEDMLSQISSNLSKTEKEKEIAKKLKKEIDELKKEIEVEKSKMKDRKDRIIRDSKQEAKRIIEEAILETDKIIEQVKQEQKKQENNVSLHKIREHKNQLRKIESNNQESVVESLFTSVKSNSIKPFKKGNSVIIISLNQKATILEEPDKKGEVWVEAGIMKVKIPISNLEHDTTDKITYKKTGISKIGSLKTQNISTQIDIRGLNVDEAIDRLDKYLDDAFMCGLQQVTIIHGKGTGALRSGIHEYLKYNTHAKKFRLGTLSEGDSGVTMVEF